jgi:(S)-mandelate dehydrogenase
MDPRFSWADLKRLRDRWPFHFVVKGILNVSDIGDCLRLGADAIVLSNHGGRQLDSVPSGIELLPSARSRYQSETLFVDGGIRRGSDVVKALAVGAQAVLLGRAPLYGLAAGGEDGVFQVVEIIKEEMARTLALLGCQRSQCLDQSYLVPSTNAIYHKTSIERH